MTILAVIPVRYESTRLPGKPLADLDGRPLVQWVYEAASRCEVFSEVIVATDSQAIAERVREFGGQVELTREDHASGTDRVAEVISRRPETDVVVNVQGDQPFVTAGMLARLVEPYVTGERPPITTLACPFTDPRAMANPNVVKVVCDIRGYALYFSRSSIPHGWDRDSPLALHHMGLYAFSRESVLAFPTLPSTPLERRERLEQLRALEHGVPIRVCLVDRPVLEINTRDDLDAARDLLRSDSSRAGGGRSRRGAAG